MTAPLDPDMFDPVCPSDLMPIRIGDKWAGMIIRCLEHGPRRFSEFRTPLHGITAKALTKSLRTLERDGLIQRTTHLDRTRRVEYQLTHSAAACSNRWPPYAPGPRTTGTNSSTHVKHRHRPGAPGSKPPRGVG